MQKVCDADNTGMAVVVGLYDVIVRDVCRQVEGVVVPANYNSLHQVVISGEVTALQRAIEKLSPAASRVIKLPVSGAFHSPFMEPIVEDYLAAVEDVEFHKPFCPVYQNVNGRPTQQVELIKKNLILQLTHPVMWRHTILHMLEDGATDFKEIGPGKLLTGLVTQIEKTWAPMPFRK
jgi:[acyl-carrier-protein] S-malonyltransferase